MGTDKNPLEEKAFITSKSKNVTIKMLKDQKKIDFDVPVEDSLDIEVLRFATQVNNLIGSKDNIEFLEGMQDEKIVS